MSASESPMTLTISPASIKPRPEQRSAMVGPPFGSASDRIGQRQTVSRIDRRAVEAPDESACRILEILGVAATLELEVHVLVAGPRALAGRADGADALPACDVFAGGHGEGGEVAVHRAIVVRLVNDHEDQSAEVVAVACDHDTPVGGGKDIAARPGGDVDATMGTEARIAFAASPVTEAGQGPRAAARANGGAHESDDRRHHEPERCDRVDDDGEEMATSISPLSAREATRGA